MRWGVEAFGPLTRTNGVWASLSDFKSRGFGVTQTRLVHPDRVERLIMVLAIALFHAVSTAMQPQTGQPSHAPKKPIAA